MKVKDWPIQCFMAKSDQPGGQYSLIAHCTSKSRVCKFNLHSFV